MVFWPKLFRMVQKERSQKNFLLGPKVSELGPNLAHLAHQENALIFILRLLLRRPFSFHAFSYNAYFHPRLLLRRLFSFPALSYCAYFYFAHSSNTLIFYYVNTVDGLYYTLRVSVPSSELGPPTPYTASEVAPPLAPRTQVGGDTFASGGGSVGGPNSDEGKESLVLYVYYNPFTVNIPILYV